MKLINQLGILLLVFFFLGCSNIQNEKTSSGVSAENDLSYIRGFNYTPAKDINSRHHLDRWIDYDEATTEFDMDLAKSLNLNQVRVMIPYIVYLESTDKEKLKNNLRKFVRTCYERGIGVMPCIGSGEWINDTTLRSTLGREWAEFMVDALSGEPGLKFWDVMNEPDWPTSPPELVHREFENAKFMSKTFHELDTKTPVTIGMAFVDGMIKLADYVDVLQFHDYMQTKDGISNNISRAKDFAVSIGKPIINGEIGCIARANPYDITLKEHIDAKVGWYIWELMIVPDGWGAVHGVFYEDGTVRDPSIAAAIMGFFRKRSADILPSVPDSEGNVIRVIDDGTTWLNQPDPSWEDGLVLAETAAHLMEAGELIAMRIPPTWEVYQLQNGETDLPALKELLTRYIEILQPYILDRYEE